MEISELMHFFGRPAQSVEFDAFLTAHGISQRPTFKDSPVERINQLEQGISLIFEERLGFEQYWGPAKENGEMIFASLQAYSEDNDSGFERYPHPLPYGLSFDSTLQQAVQIFGEPTVDHPSGDNRVYVWHNFHDKGYTVALCLLPDDKGISFFDLEPAKLRAPRKRR